MAKQKKARRDASGALKVLFVDQISFGCLLRIFLLGRSLETIWYFEPLSPGARRMLCFFRFLGLVRANQRQVEHCIGNVGDESGSSPWTTLNKRKSLDLASKVREQEVIGNPLIRHMSSVWAEDRLLYLFYAQIAEFSRVEYIRINLVKWIVATQLSCTLAQSALLIGRTQWFSYLAECARAEGVNLIAYRNWLDPFTGVRPVFRFMRTLRKRMPGMLGLAGKFLRRRAGRPPPATDSKFAVNGSKSSTCTVAIKYSSQELTFDPALRSDLFWVGESGVPHSDVLIYDYSPQSSTGTWEQELLEQNGVRLLGWGPGVPTWKPTFGAVSLFLKLSLKLASGVLKTLVRGRWVPIYYIQMLIVLARDYCYWTDFYANNQVRVNVGTNSHMTLGQVLALDALGGISVNYQYTANIDDYLTPLISNGENVQCLFAPAFESPFRTVGAPVDRYVHVGFVYDSALPAIRQKGHPSDLRKELRDNGAEFVICFFDENSMDVWASTCPNEDAAGEYAFLLRWLLDDPTIGLVCKPKRSTTLFQRMSSISELIEKAQNTGRCKILLSDFPTSSVYPAEAALAADVCISRLGGLTAGLEARLVGVPSVLVGTHHVAEHPFHDWGRGRVVFDDWQSARVAVERWRADPDSSPEFGDWSPALDQLDSFRDGRGTERLGSYIHWVYDSLKEGHSQAEALETASNKFQERWAKEFVTVGR